MSAHRRLPRVSAQAYSSPGEAAWGTTHRPGTRARRELPPATPHPAVRQVLSHPALSGLPSGGSGAPDRPRPSALPLKGGAGWNRSRKSLRVLSPGPSRQVGGFPSGGEALSRRPSASVPPAGAQTLFSQHYCDPSSPRLPTPSSCFPPALLLAHPCPSPSSTLSHSCPRQRGAQALLSLLSKPHLPALPPSTLH